MRNPSDDYLRCLKEARNHHASSKTYSGRLLRPHAPFIKEVIDRNRCRSVLDYGCGKGSQYEWIPENDDASIPKGMTIEQYWGVRVRKYDPAYPPFAVEPSGLFDLVICTHVLGSIPVIDIDWVIERIFGYARKAVYIAEKIGEVHKEVFSRPDLMPRWSAHQWRMLLGARRKLGVECTFAAREETESGVVVNRQIL